MEVRKRDRPEKQVRRKRKVCVIRYRENGGGGEKGRRMEEYCRN